MKGQVLSLFQNTNLIVIAMLLFLFSFLTITAWAMARANRSYFERMAKLPLDGNQGDAP